MKNFLRLSLFVVALGLAARADAGTTEVSKDHPLLSTEASDAVATVYFLRVNPGFRGVMGKNVSIRMEGKELLSLAKGQYTLVRLKPWAGEVITKSWTVENRGGQNSMVKTQTECHLTFEAGKEYYVNVDDNPTSVIRASSFLPVMIERGEAVKLATGLTAVGSAVQSPLADASPPEGQAH